MILLMLNIFLHGLVVFAEFWTSGPGEVRFEFISKKWTIIEISVELIILGMIS